MNRKTLIGSLVLGLIALLFVVAFMRTGNAPAGDEHGHGHGGEEHAEAGHDDDHAEGGDEHQEPEHGETGHGEAGHDEHEGKTAASHEEAKRGPHGGRLFHQGDYGFEVTIYETGVEPQFRVYAFKDDESLAPNEVKLQATVNRLGGTEMLAFRAEADYLRSLHVIYEPHSFEVVFTATVAQQNFTFGYSQEEGRVTLPAASLQSGGIVIETSGPQRIASTLKLPGIVQIKHDSRAHIVPRVAGVATDVRFPLGAKIKKGDVLLVLDSRELAELKSAYLTAWQRLQLASATYEREARLWQQKITSEQDFLSAQKEKAESEIALRASKQSLLALGVTTDTLNKPEQLAQGSLTRYEVRAPFAGVVLNRHVSQGEAVSADALVYEIGNIGEMEAEISVYADDLARVTTGQNVRLRSVNGEGEAEGKILTLSSTVAEGNRAAIAHVEFANPELRWRDGQFVEASIVLDETEVAVAVRKEALQSFRDWTVVFAQYGEQFEVRPVTLGRSDGEYVEVLEGLPAGQAYAATNAFVLKAELGKAGASHDH